MKYAILDVGTNNVLFLISELQNGKVIPLHRAANISAMGKNMSNGYLSQTALNSTKRILADNINFARLFTKNIIVLGTSCSREAGNIDEISNWLHDKFGLKYNIISGELEAELSGIATLREFPEYRDFVTFDVGGGSTEFNFVRDGRIISSQSLPLGIRRLDNTFLSDSNAKKNEIDKILDSLQIPVLPDHTVIGVGGTVTSLAAYKIQMEKYDGEKVHKSLLTQTEVRLILDDFLSMTHDEIAYLIPFDRNRADILATGTMIVLEIMHKLKADEIVVSDHGMQFGILYKDADFISNLLS